MANRSVVRPVFAGMLNEMRLGVLTPKSIDTFRSLSRPIKYQDDLDATELCVVFLLDPSHLKRRLTLLSLLGSPLGQRSTTPTAQG